MLLKQTLRHKSRKFHVVVGKLVDLCHSYFWTWHPCSWYNTFLSLSSLLIAVCYKCCSWSALKGTVDSKKKHFTHKLLTTLWIHGLVISLFIHLFWRLMNRMALAQAIILIVTYSHVHSLAIYWIHVQLFVDINSYFAMQTWWRRQAGVQSEWHNGEGRGFKWLWTRWRLVGLSFYSKW